MVFSVSKFFSVYKLYSCFIGSSDSTKFWVLIVLSFSSDSRFDDISISVFIESSLYLFLSDSSEFINSLECSSTIELVSFSPIYVELII